MFARRTALAWETRDGGVRDGETGMRFTGRGLVFGVDTVLAHAGDSPRDVRVDPADQRLAALLVAAHLVRPTASQLTHLVKAADRRRDGDDALAAMHLALSGLSKLEQPAADAYRLHLADHLLKSGARPADLLAALDPLAKYEADQPRVPAGSGRPSGQWTSDGGGADAGSPSATPGAAAGPARAPVAPTSPPASSRSASASASTPAREQAPPRSGEVNPDTVTPTDRYVRGFPYRGVDACRVAHEECLEFAREEDVTPGSANDNSRTSSQIALACHKVDEQCFDAQVLVRQNPKAIGAIGFYPDGARIIMVKGKEPLYIPRGYSLIPWRRAAPGGLRDEHVADQRL